MDRPQAMALGMAVVAILIGVTLGRAGQGDGDLSSLQPVTPPAQPADEGGGITVYVSGSVVSPGVVRLPAGSIVADAIAAAGGALPEARLSEVNLAQPLGSGEQVRVPGPGDEVAASGTSGDGRIPINRATASELEELPGVGPVLAERIIAHREANGPFQTPEDLLDVPGIGEAKLAALRDSIIVP